MERDPELFPTSDPETVKAVRHLLGELSQNNPKRREAAEQEIRAMGIEYAFAIREIFRADVEKEREAYRKGAKYGPWGNAGFVVLGLLPILIMRNQFGPMVGLALMVCSAVGILWHYRETLVNSHRRRASVLRALRHLCQITDKHAIPVLLDLQMLAPIETIAPAVMQLLPKLDADDAHLFSGDHLSCLNQCLSLNCYYAPDHRTIILVALSKVGNASSIPVVRRLAYSRYDDTVRAAACECLEHLERRIEAHDQTLLRPAQVLDQVGILLRAAGVSERAIGEDLLRAASGATVGQMVENCHEIADTEHVVSG